MESESADSTSLFTTLIRIVLVDALYEAVVVVKPVRLPPEMEALDVEMDVD